MKKTMIAVVMLLSSTAAFAQQREVPFTVQKQPPRVELDIGMVQIRTHTFRYRIAYLPLLAPLPYSWPRTTQEIPNALVLTGTQLPMRPQPSHDETDRR